MNLLGITDQIIDDLLICEKRIKNPRAKETPKAKHRERNYEVVSLSGQYNFTLIVRQSTMVAADFSCGLLWHEANGQKVMLARYNGFSHEHDNPIEGITFDGACHIHRATERYIGAGRKAEHFALPTDRYSDLGGALRCLLTDCRIMGMGQTGNDNDSGQSELLL